MESEEAKEKNTKATISVHKRRKRASTINDIGSDMLIKIFGYLDPLDVVRTSAVTKSWYGIIQRSSLWRDAYCKQRHSLINHFKEGFLPEIPPKDWVKQLVGQQHAAALVHGSVQVSCWKGHSTGYADPEAAIGCGDGTIRIFDMYSSQCSRIFRQHGGAVTCLSIVDEFLISGTSLGSLSVSDAASGQKIASLRHSTAVTGYPF